MRSVIGITTSEAAVCLLLEAELSAPRNEVAGRQVHLFIDA